MEDKNNIWLKNINLVLPAAILLFSIFSQIIYGMVWKNNTDTEIKQIKDKVLKLEENSTKDHEQLLEIGINLKLFMENQGLTYFKKGE